MLVTNAQDLKKYASAQRRWQGIPSVERTQHGRIFVSFYSGGETEQLGNYGVLVFSDDGKDFSEPVAVADIGADARAYDCCLWIDPLNRLWFIWSVAPGHRVEFARCDHPDAETLQWSEIRTIGYDVMLNKPTVTSWGDWLFPCAVWKPGLDMICGYAEPGHPTGAHVFQSRDQGESFHLLGTAVAPDRSFDEHMLLEKKDGSLEMYIRTKYGVAISRSSDRGRTWSPGVDCGFGGPNSRFYIGRLRSGRILLVNHYRFCGRSHLTAMLSDDDGAHYSGFLVLDERSEVSYPDVTEGSDGYLYIVYDRERGAYYNPNRDYSNSAREILMAKITERDILAGRLIEPGSRLKITVSKLGSGKATGGQ